MQNTPGSYVSPDDAGLSAEAAARMQADRQREDDEHFMAAYREVDKRMPLCLNSEEIEEELARILCVPLATVQENVYRLFPDE